MSTAMTASYQIHAIPATVLDNARRSGVDVSGNAVEQIISEGGEPLRCCLRDARPDERCILFGYEPPIRASPYREIGAVFAHAERCGGPASDVDYPSDWISRPQILRAYDSRGWIHPATKMHDGSDPESVITQMLADADVVQIHSRNIAYGCYMFTVTRAGWTGQPSSSETCQVDRSADCVERAHDASRSVPAPSAAVGLLSGSSLPSPAAPDRLPLQPAGTEDSVQTDAVVVDVGHDMEDHERHRVERAASLAGDDVDRQRVRHHHAHDSVHQQPGAPQDAGHPPNPAEAGICLREHTPGPGCEDLAVLEEREGEDQRGGTASPDADDEPCSPQTGDRTVLGQKEPGAVSDDRNGDRSRHGGHHEGGHAVEAGTAG